MNVNLTRTGREHPGKQVCEQADVATNVSLTPDKPGASGEREPRPGQAGSIVRSEAVAKAESNQLALTKTNSTRHCRTVPQDATKAALRARTPARGRCGDSDESRLRSADLTKLPYLGVLLKNRQDLLDAG
jgi:hypothetical protein